VCRDLYSDTFFFRRDFFSALLSFRVTSYFWTHIQGNGLPPPSLWAPPLLVETADTKGGAFKRGAVNRFLGSDNVYFFLPTVVTYAVGFFLKKKQYFKKIKNICRRSPDEDLLKFFIKVNLLMSFVFLITSESSTT